MLMFISMIAMHTECIPTNWGCSQWFWMLYGGRGGFFSLIFHWLDLGVIGFRLLVYGLDGVLISLGFMTGLGGVGME